MKPFQVSSVYLGMKDEKKCFGGILTPLEFQSKYQPGVVDTNGTHLDSAWEKDFWNMIDRFRLETFRTTKKLVRIEEDCTDPVPLSLRDRIKKAFKLRFY